MTIYRNDTPERCAGALKKSGKLTVALLGVALGVVLLILGNARLTGRGEQESAQASPAEGEITRSVEQYREDLETRIKAICGQVAGVGAVDVIVTLEGGYEYVYATDKKPSAGGESLTYVTVGSGEKESLVYVTERAPAVVGVGVVCTGGSDATVKREVTALLSAALGVGSNKIYVTGR